MDIQTYNSIVKKIRNHRGLSKDCLLQLQTQFINIKKDTLASIISHEYVKRMKTNHIKTAERIDKYYNCYIERLIQGDKPGILTNLAVEFDITPSLMARMILEKHFNDNPLNEQVSKGNSNENHLNGELKVDIKKYLRDTSLIPDPVLAYEVYLCNLYDDQYSPVVETMRMSLGQEYEVRLQREMTNLGLAFRDEEYLRKFGYDKTPDVKLELPVAVDGFIINWVESKALFGDEHVHKEYMKNQYLSYLNRFGSGLVIYWFGFLETLQAKDKRIIIRDHFPSNLTHMIPPNEDVSVT